MRRLILPILLALSLVLAGCNGLALGNNETPEQTLTPAPVPTDKPTPTPVPQLAPGLTGTGITDPFALVEAHAAVLNGTSYTFYKNATVWYANGTVFDQRIVHTQIAANDRRFYIQRNWSNISIWSNGERVFIARMSNNGTSYNVPRGPDTEPAPPQEILEIFIGSRGDLLATYFSSVETRVVGSTTRNGTTLYRVVATNVTNPFAFETAKLRNPRNLTLRALISSRGLVREYHLHYTATLNNETVHVRRHVRYTNIGSTTVERPPWYDEAIGNISTTTPTQ